MESNTENKKKPVSDLLRYSGAYKEMGASELFDAVLTQQDVMRHPILKDFEIDNFYLRRLKYFQEIPDSDFYNEGVRSFMEVPKRNIVGTNHSAYAGRTWLTDVTALQRGYCKSEEDVLCLFPADGKRHGGLVELSLYGDEYYITNGNNRVNQAQFAPAVNTIPSMVTEYVFDERRYGLASRISRIGAELECPGIYRIRDRITVQYGSITLHLRFDEDGVADLESAVRQASQLSGRKMRLFFLSRYHKDRIGGKLWYNLCNPVDKKLAVIKMASNHLAEQPQIPSA